MTSSSREFMHRTPNVMCPKYRAKRAWLATLLESRRPPPSIEHHSDFSVLESVRRDVPVKGAVACSVVFGPIIMEAVCGRMSSSLTLYMPGLLRTATPLASPAARSAAFTLAVSVAVTPVGGGLPISTVGGRCPPGSSPGRSMWAPVHSFTLVIGSSTASARLGASARSARNPAAAAAAAVSAARRVPMRAPCALVAAVSSSDPALCVLLGSDIGPPNRACFAIGASYLETRPGLCGSLPVAGHGHRRAATIPAANRGQHLSRRTFLHALHSCLLCSHPAVVFPTVGRPTPIKLGRGVGVIEVRDHSERSSAGTTAVRCTSDLSVTTNHLASCSGSRLSAAHSTRRVDPCSTDRHRQSSWRSWHFSSRWAAQRSPPSSTSSRVLPKSSRASSGSWRGHIRERTSQVPNRRI